MAKRAEGGETAFTIGTPRGSEPMRNIVRVTTADESVEWESSEVVVRHTQEGVKITPSKLGDNPLGFATLFYPWSEIRQIKEFERA